MSEEWIDIKGYEGLYKVSNTGRIFSLKTNKLMSTYTNNKGYKCIHLRKDGVIYRYKVHRLVGVAFIPNPENLPFINHKDENPSNNMVTNLEWCTASYNINYGTRVERQRYKVSKPVYQFTLSGELIKEWKSASDAARELHINPGRISDCCLGKTKYSHGFLWRYTNTL